MRSSALRQHRPSSHAGFPTIPTPPDDTRADEGKFRRAPAHQPTARRLSLMRPILAAAAAALSYKPGRPLCIATTPSEPVSSSVSHHAFESAHQLQPSFLSYIHATVTRTVATPISQGLPVPALEGPLARLSSELRFVLDSGHIQAR